MCSLLCRVAPAALGLLAVLIAAALQAQVTRLPAVAPAEELYPGQLTSFPGSGAELLQEPGGLDLPAQPELPPGARPGMFQKLLFTGSWLGDGGGADAFGISDLETKVILALPIPSRDYPLIITPGFGVHYLDGPAGSGLPKETYDAYAQFRWMRRLSPQLGIDLAITPGVFSDFKQDSDDALRLTGHAAAMWTYTEDFKWVLGAAYIDRYSTDILPIFGFIWTPHEDVKFDLVFPHPRISWVIRQPVPYSDDTATWGYIAGELGGGVWSVERAGAVADEIDYTDYRLVFGLEGGFWGGGGIKSHIEIGYVFGRKLRYASRFARYTPNDTVMLRAGLTF
ncbi:MAG: hypothetical protein HQ567_04555 [Candidatus Nealsonbacteria bacterium]|nr:hypothetical protein [Candidatus Nealsonbacteria bacterium]